MSAAPEIKIRDEHEELLKTSLSLVEKALEALGRDNDITIEELKNTKTGLKLLIETNPGLAEDIEKALVVREERKAVTELIADIRIAKQAKELRDVEGEKIREVLTELRQRMRNALAAHYLSPGLKIIQEVSTELVPSAAPVTPSDEKTIEAKATPLTDEIKEVVESKDDKKEKPEDKWDDEADLKSKQEKFTKEMSEKVKKEEDLWSLFKEIVDEEGRDTSSPAARAIWKTLTKHKDANIDELRQFMESPDVLTSNKRGKLMGKIEEKKEELKKIELEINDNDKELTAVNKGTDKEIIKKLREDKKKLRDDQAKLTKEIKGYESELQGLPKTSSKTERDYNSLESRLFMINYYFAEKEADRRNPKNESEVIGKPVKYQELLKATHKAIETEEEVELEAKGWTKFFDKVGSIFRPTLSSTLEVIHKKDDDLSTIDPAHFMKLKDVANEDRGLKRWIKKLEGTEEDKMQKIVPKLIAHLEIALNEGNMTQINTFSKKYTKELLKQLRKEVRDHALDKAKNKEGQAIEKLDVYFDTLNSINVNKQEVSKDIVFDYSKDKLVKNITKTTLAAGAFTGVGYIGTLFGPYIASMSGGALLGGYLGIKGAREKDPKKAERFKNWGVRAALLPVLGTGAIAGLGITAPLALGAIGTAGLLAPNFWKNRKSIFGAFSSSNNSVPTSSAPTATTSSTT